MNDSESSVKDSAAWTLGRIAQFHMDSIGNHFVEFINTLVNSLQDEPRVASNACFAINNVAEQFPRDMENHPLHLPFLSMCQNLAAAAERNDSYESNLRSSAYEALNSLVVNASNSNIENVKSMVGPFMERLDKTFHMPVLSDDDRNTQAELQGLLCGVLQSLCRRLESDINPFAEQMMVLFLRLFQMKSASTLSEEALMAVGSLINAIGMEFERFAKEFINYLGAALQNTRAYQVCQIAVGIVGDLSRALGPKLINFTDSLVNDLLKGLQDGTLKREVKPLILAALGDIALAVGGNFDRYFAVVMDVLAQASATAGNIKLEETEDIDVIDYMNSLRESICEAYSGIIQGLSGDGKVDLVLNYANGILQLLAAITSDGLRTEEVTRGAVGLLGDLVANLGSQLNSGAQIRTAFEPLLQLCESAPSASTRDTAAWARQAIEQNCK
jgi:importin subunit beta-1